MSITNRFVLVASKHGGSSVVPFISVDDTTRGNGVLTSADKRALPGATAITLLAAFMARAGAHCVAKDHGVRLMLQGTSPAFIESKGMSDGTLYVFGGSAKRGALEARMVSAGIDVASCVFRVEGKGGLYVTMPAGMTEDQANSVWDTLCGADFTSAGGGNGYVSDARLGMECGGVALDAISPPVASPKPDKGTKADGSPDKRASNRGRPKRVEKQASAE